MPRPQSPARALLVLLAALVVGLAQAVAAAPVNAQEQPDAGDPPIAYRDCPGDDCGLFVREPSGTVRRLTSHDGDGSPTWSPDGREIAFSRDADDGGGLFVVARDGSGQRQISEDVAVNPAWSPDGRWVGFQRGAGGTGAPTELAVVPADGATGMVLDTDIQRFSWAPDGQRLVASRDYEGEGPAELRIVSLTGDLQRTIPLAEPVPEGTPAWSPDGTRIAYSAQEDANRFATAHAFVVGAEGGPSRRVGQPDNRVTRGAWSPDGTRLALDRLRLVSTNVVGSQVDVVAADGSLLAEFAPEGEVAFDPAWSEDGERVYAITRPEASGGNARVTAIDADGSNPRHLVTSGTQHAVGPHLTVRRFGATRVETAVALSRAAFEQAGTVVVAPADSYAEALAAAPLAAQSDAPILLLPPDRATAEVRDEIDRLGATTAILVGSEEQLGAGVEADLRDAGIEELQRIEGADGLDTAAAVARRVGGTAAYVVEGTHPDPERGWPDAVSVSALAAHEDRAVLMVENDRLPAATRTAIRDLGVEQVTIVGGTAAVSEAVAEELRGLGVDVDRLAGATRYETSRAVAQRSLEAGLSARTPWLVTGEAFADALTAGPAAARSGSALALVARDDLDNSPPTRQWLTANDAEQATLVGGRAAIGHVTATQIAQVLADR